jgi:hypothetical protein
VGPLGGWEIKCNAMFFLMFQVNLESNACCVQKQLGELFAFRDSSYIFGSINPLIIQIIKNKA